MRIINYLDSTIPQSSTWSRVYNFVWLMFDFNKDPSHQPCYWPNVDLCAHALKIHHLQIFLKNLPMGSRMPLPWIEVDSSCNDFLQQAPVTVELCDFLSHAKIESSICLSETAFLGITEQGFSVLDRASVFLNKMTRLSWVLAYLWSSSALIDLEIDFMVK